MHTTSGEANLSGIDGYWAVLHGCESFSSIVQLLDAVWELEGSWISQKSTQRLENQGWRIGSNQWRCSRMKLQARVWPWSLMYSAIATMYRCHSIPLTPDSTAPKYGFQGYTAIIAAVELIFLTLVSVLLVHNLKLNGTGQDHLDQIEPLHKVGEDMLPFRHFTLTCQNIGIRNI